MRNGVRRLCRTTAKIEAWDPDVFGSDKSIFNADRVGAPTYSDSGNPTEGT